MAEALRRVTMPMPSSDQCQRAAGGLWVPRSHAVVVGPAQVIGVPDMICDA